MSNEKMEKKEQEVAEEYLSSLADLNLNSKPLINMLTILAEENIEHAPIIVKAVDQHIAKVNPDVKLPVLYLIDSIVKNVGREYIQLFSHCIVNIFCGVFEKVNEKIREKMYTLRQTWNDVFTPQKLYTLDVKVNCMDPNWPITAKVVPKSPAIHVNPNFLKNKAEPLNEMQAKLRDKQRQLLELQKRKLELELAATKQKLEEQEKQLTMQTESVKSAHVPSTVPTSNLSVRPVFNPYKQSQPRSPNVQNMLASSIMGVNSMSKTRVAPVTSTMLNIIRHRDPRLARQQQAMQQQQLQNTSVTAGSIAPAGKQMQVEHKFHELQTEAANKPKNVELNNLDKINEKLTAMKSATYGNKDKQRNTSSLNNNKRSQLKTNSEKSSSSSNKSPTRASLSSSRSKSNRSTSSKNSGSGLKSLDKDSRAREKSLPSEKKKSGRADSPVRTAEKLTLVAKPIEKSPKRSAGEGVKSSGSPTINAAKFKDIKQGIKSRNYMRRNREKSKSPKPLRQDLDLRSFPLPDKRIKISDSVEDGIFGSNRMETTSSVLQMDNGSKLQSLDQNLEAGSCKDVDLRQFQTNSANTNSSTVPENGAKGLETDMEAKKRLSTDNSDEPMAKKSKSEKLDTLFGTEDVDLRTLGTNSGNSNLPMTPPPPPIISNETENWAKVKGSKSIKTSPAKSNLDDVRAKLAKATKGMTHNLNIVKEPKSILNKARFIENSEDSTDGTDANIRTIITQAQELLDSENMDVDQYNTLVKTVIQINETNKLKEAQRRESLLSRSSNNIEDLTPISDEEVKFSSEDETAVDKIGHRKPKPKLLTKRIPKLAKDETNEVNLEQNSILQRLSPTPPASANNYNDMRSVNINKNDKRLRQKESKWSSPWDHPMNSNQKLWPVSNNHRSNFLPKPNHMQQNLGNNRVPMLNPWQNPPPMIFANVTPAPPPPMPPMKPMSADNSVPPVLLQSQLSNSVDNPNSDVMRTINIDNVPKEIRFYDEIAIAFMDWDQPKEIGFQSGQRRIIVDDRDHISLSFNDAYKAVMIDGKPHQMRFGCPTRELYIDNNWYECYFGEPPIGIILDKRVRIFKIEGPAPQVRIGNLRLDLVVGKINLIIDARIIVPVFLDAKLQVFELDGKSHTLQFADYLKTVLIDNEPMPVEYGGLPKSLYLNGVKHFVRFGTLPNGIVPGKVFIHNMICTEQFKGMEPPPTSIETETQQLCGLTKQVLSENITETVVNTPIELNQPSTINTTINDNITKRPEVPASVPTSTESSKGVATEGSLTNVNIDELFQKLLASGILNQPPNTSKVSEDNNSKKPKDKDIITPIDLSKPDTIKSRQAGIVQSLFSGMQCSSCGVRFPPEQTIKYSQHLDWHFRQNRRERDSSRRAHSRKWFYDVSDWIQYEEIEDLDEREKNWFETQQNELDNMEEGSNQRTNSPPPSCPAGPDEVDRSCDMCHDKFEHFFNEESEEWHLRSAIRIDDKIYHPLCYEDYKSSLTFEEISPEGDDNAVDSVIVKKERKEDGKSGPADYEDDDDDVIVVPMEEPSITEIPDDDEEDEESVVKNVEDLSDNAERKNEPENKSMIDKINDSVESDVEIQEPHIPFTDLDTYEETHQQSISTIDESSQSSQFNNVKIKEEPKDEAEDDDDVFEDVGTFTSIGDLSQNVDEYIPQATNVTTTGHDNLLASIDGNVEIQDAPTTVNVNKIKINITKNVTSQKQNTNTNFNENSSNSIQVICNMRESNDNINKNTGFSDYDSNNKIPVCTTSGTVTTTNNDKSESHTRNVEDDDISYVVKSELQDVDFKKMPKVNSGFETSGLCSIM